jgi:hypothetical protein
MDKVEVECGQRSPLKYGADPTYYDELDPMLHKGPQQFQEIRSFGYHLAAFPSSGRIPAMYAAVGSVSGTASNR